MGISSANVRRVDARFELGRFGAVRMAPPRPRTHLFKRDYTLDCGGRASKSDEEDGAPHEDAGINY
ncbi:hypothetical protein [Bradyrhizobium liaoningense]